MVHNLNIYKLTEICTPNSKQDTATQFHSIIMVLNRYVLPTSSTLYWNMLDEGPQTTFRAIEKDLLVSEPG